VFFQALGAVSRYTDRGSDVSTWLYRIAHNLVANWHRDTARRTRSLPKLGLAEPDDPVEDLISRELREKVRRAVAKLSAERQRLIALKFSEGLSNAEIGEILGKSEGAVKLLLHRTIKRLRQELLPEVEEP
jgi:RNA polymerase sigma-70 factor (ECF subfamily)